MRCNSCVECVLHRIGTVFIRHKCMFKRLDFAVWFGQLSFYNTGIKEIGIEQLGTWRTDNGVVYLPYRSPWYDDTNGCNCYNSCKQNH